MALGNGSKAIFILMPGIYSPVVGVYMDCVVPPKKLIIQLGCGTKPASCLRHNYQGNIIPSCLIIKKGR
jgi:hypothetical protein